MNEVKKKFFRRPSVAQIRDNTNHKGEVRSDFWENIAELKENESITLVGNIFPYGFTDPNDFLKNGPLVEVPTKDKENANLRPFEIREKTFDTLPKHRLRYAGFTFTPHIGVDKTPRLIRLNEIFDAAKLYAYAPLTEEFKPFHPSMQIKEIYDWENGAKEIGASFISKSPSRTKGRGRYTMKMDHVPIIDDKNKFNIAYMIKTDHVCEDKRHYLKFPTKKRPDYIADYFVDAHEIHVQFGIMQHYANRAREIELQTGKRPEIIPMEMNLTGIPTQFGCAMYNLFLHQVLIKPSANSKIITPLEGHIEALLWEGIVKEGYKKLLFNEGGEKLKDFPWTQYGQIKK